MWDEMWHPSKKELVACFPGIEPRYFMSIPRLDTQLGVPEPLNITNAGCYIKL